MVTSHWTIRELLPVHLAQFCSFRTFSYECVRGVKSLNYLRQTCVQRSIRDFVNLRMQTAILRCSIWRNLCIFGARFAIDHGTFGDDNFAGTPALVGHSLKLLDQVPQCVPAWLRHWLQVTDQSVICHGNFGPAKILVRGTKIPGKFGPPDYYFQKNLVRAWNNGPSANTWLWQITDQWLQQSLTNGYKSLTNGYTSLTKQRAITGTPCTVLHLLYFLSIQKLSTSTCAITKIIAHFSMGMNVISIQCNRSIRDTLGIK